MTKPTKLQEAVARAIYNQLPYDGPPHTSKPAWTLNGNSLKQGEARDYAQAAIRAMLDAIMEPGWRAISAGDTEDSAMSLDRWQAMVNHIKKRECGE